MKRQRTSVAAGVVKVGPMELTRYVIPLAPKVKPRASKKIVKTKSGALQAISYKTPQNRAYEDLVHEAAMPQHPSLVPYSSRLSFRLLIYQQALRGDISNLLKAIEDGLRRGVYTDDCLIDELYVRRWKAGSIPPQSIVQVAPMNSRLILPQDAFTTKACVMCGCTGCGTKQDLHLDF